MEVSGVIFRPLQSFVGSLFGTHSSQPSSSGLSIVPRKRFSCELRFLGFRDSEVTVKPRELIGFSSSGFSDNGHLQYYVSPRCGGKKSEMLKDNGSGTATIKKKLKLVKGLWRSLSKFSEMGFVEIGDGSVGNYKGKTISEVAEVLLVHLQQLKAEKKVIKRKRKEEKARLKAARVKSEDDSESSSSSSDSECGEVVNMSLLRIGSHAEPEVDEGSAAIHGEASLTSQSQLTMEKKMVEVIEDHSLLSCGQKCCDDTNNGSSISSSVVRGASVERIEVCMGGKCKKSGAAAWLEEFERKVGIEGTVIGCKCMGKCRDGPNVRVLHHSHDDLAYGIDSSVKHPTNTLYIGVGLEDVDVIVANLLGERKDLGLMIQP